MGLAEWQVLRSTLGKKAGSWERVCSFRRRCRHAQCVGARGFLELRGQSGVPSFRLEHLHNFEPGARGVLACLLNGSTGLMLESSLQETWYRHGVVSWQRLKRETRDVSQDEEEALCRKAEGCMRV